MKIQTVTEMKRQRRQAKAPSAEKKKTEPGRDGRKIRLKDVGGLITLFDENAGAYEGIRFSSLLNDWTPDAASDDEKRSAHQWGDLRRHMLEVLHGLYARSEASALKSVDWARVGTSGFGPTSLSVSRYAAFTELSEINTAIPPECKRIIETVLLKDQFIWRVRSRAEKRSTLESIQFALDCAAYVSEARLRRDIRRTISYSRMELRWPDQTAGIAYMQRLTAMDLKDRAEAIRRTVRSRTERRAATGVT